MLETAIAHHHKGELGEAEALYRRVLREEPENPDALHWLGVLCHQRGRLDEAVQALKRAVASRPEASGSYACLCLVLRDQGKLREAVAAGERSLQLFPANPELCNAMGRIFQQTGDRQRAAKFFRRAVRLDARFADAYHNLAITLEASGQSDRACEAYGRALTLDPDDAQVHYNLGLSLISLGEYAKAREAAERALALDPGHVQALYTRAYLRRFVCDWDDEGTEAKGLEDALAAHVENRGDAEIAPYALNIVPVSPECHRAVAEYYASQTALRTRGLRDAFTHRDHKHARLRLGYISPDFRHHAVGFLVHRLFEHHDRAAFEVFAYSLHCSDDEFQQAVRKGVDVFRDVSAMSSVEAAEAIHRDEVDVLIDLGGFTWGTRPEILSLRPAPVQISWLGYLNTMGADYIDYLVADDVVVPEGHEQRYAEAVIRLPGTFMPMFRLDRADPVPAPNDLGLPANTFVFASFNNPYKITAGAFDTWMQILERSPESVLWLYAADLEEAEGNLRARARRSGMADRLVFAPTVPLSEHLERLTHADLFLDTFHYNAGATAVAALQAGVPILTHPGKTFLSRMGASLNAALGLDDLICDSPASYREKAVALSGKPGERADVRDRLALAIESSAVFEPRCFVAGLEEACRHVWRRWQRGEPPESIRLR